MADILPKGRTVPHRSHVAIAFGDPMELADGEDAKAFNRRIETAVRALAGGS
jgi:flagellar motor protein MotB